jgi:multidrug efflux pump subunit AcrB
MKFDFGKWAFDNNRLVSFLVAVLLLGGAYSYYIMPKLEDPEIKVRQALVVGVYPGASAHQVELEMVDPLEKSIRQMKDIHHVESYCFADMAILTVELESTVKGAALEQTWDILRRKVNSADVPNGVRLAVKDDFGDVFGMFYALTGDGLSDRDLSDYAELLKRELSTIDGVSRIDIYGKRTECINVSIHQDRLAALGVTPMEVLSTLNGQNSTAYSGYLRAGDLRVRVTVNDKYRTAEDIANLLIAGHEGDQIRLRDIAQVEMDYADPVRNSMSYDGQRALGISISATSGTDITKIGKEVETLMEYYRQNKLPVGVEFHQVFFQPDRVKDALGTFMLNLLESVILVVVVLIFTMGLKSGLIIGASLVVIVAGSILVLNSQDGTLQRVSLGSFILAMGMLVDNAIVIVDGILVARNQGKPRLEALTSIGRQTAMPLLGATLIAILAFLPIFLSPDTTGTYVRDLFIVIAISLLLSWILALVHVPLMAGRSFYRKKHNWQELLAREYRLRRIRKMRRTHTLPDVIMEERIDKERPRDSHAGQQESGDEVDETQQTIAFEAVEKTEIKSKSAPEPYGGKFYTWLRNVLDFSIHYRWVTVSLLLAALAISAYCYRFLPQGFFPDMTYDQLYLEYKLPEGANWTRVSRDLDSIQAYLRKRPEIRHITASTGGTPSRYNLVRSIASPSLSYGELIVDFVSSDALVENMEEIQSELTDMFPDAYVKLKRYNLMYKKYPIEVKFQGPDPAVLHALSDSCRAIMLRTGAVRLLTTDWGPQQPVLVVDYNQQNAREVGLSRKEVTTSLLAATDGIPASSFYEGIHNVPIYIKCVDDNGQPLERLEDATVFGVLPNVMGVINEETLMGYMSGAISKETILEEVMRSIPLRQVANDIHIEWEDPLVIRYNGERAQRVQCSPVADMGTEEARRVVEKALAEQLDLPFDYTMSWGGEAEASTQSMKYLFKNFPLAIILIIAILILLFKDYKTPVILFCCIPMILIGVIPSVLFSGKTFGFVAIVGVLGLIGMMLKNGIVLMDEIRLQISTGKNPYDCLIDASLSRLRPVMMAALTTILGMIPLVPDAFFGSMAVTIMGGLFVGTIITLVIIPVLYAIFFNVKKK